MGDWSDIAKVALDSKVKVRPAHIFVALIAVVAILALPREVLEGVKIGDFRALLYVVAIGLFSYTAVWLLSALSKGWRVRRSLASLSRHEKAIFESAVKFNSPLIGCRPVSKGDYLRLIKIGLVDFVVTATTAGTRATVIIDQTAFDEFKRLNPDLLPIAQKTPRIPHEDD